MSLFKAALTYVQTKDRGGTRRVERSNEPELVPALCPSSSPATMMAQRLLVTVGRSAVGGGGVPVAALGASRALTIGSAIPMVCAPRSSSAPMWHSAARAMFPNTTTSMSEAQVRSLSRTLPKPSNSGGEVEKAATSALDEAPRRDPHAPRRCMRM